MGLRHVLDLMMTRIRDVRAKGKSKSPWFGPKCQGTWDIIYEDTGEQGFGDGVGKESRVLPWVRWAGFA